MAAKARVMTSLGKRQVLLQSYLDGELKNEKPIRRVVYQDAEGKFYVSFLGQKHGREVTRRRDGVFVWEFKVTTIPSRILSNEDFLSELTRRRDV